MFRPFNRKDQKPRRKPKPRIKIKKKDPLFVELLKKRVNRHGRIVSRRKTGCTAVSQHAVAQAIKRARHMALLPYVGE